MSFNHIWENTDGEQNISPENGKTALLLAIFGGVFGLHRLYLGNAVGIVLTIVMWIVIGVPSSEAGSLLLLFLWAIIDIVLLVSGHYKDGRGRLVLVTGGEKFFKARAREGASGVEIYAFDVPQKSRESITALSIPSLIDGAIVTGIADGAFKDCKALVTVSFPRTVTSIGESAFEGCNNLSLKTLANIREIQRRAKIPPEELLKQKRQKRRGRARIIAALFAVPVIVACLLLRKYDVRYNESDFSVAMCHIAAMLGDKDARFQLARYYVDSDYDADYSKAVKLLMPLAKEGDALSQCVIGAIYMEGGRGITQDYSTAVVWFKKAAMQNVDKVAYQIGQLYEKGGNGLLQDYKEAAMWYKKAAQQDMDVAMISVADLFQQAGYDLSLSDVVSVWDDVAPYDSVVTNWYKKMAKSGGTAAYQLALLYSQGLGVGQDNDKALEYAKQAYDAGDPKAQAAILLLKMKKMLVEY